MYVKPDEIGSTARVWIYSTNRFLSETEVANIQQELQFFISKWTAHNLALQATAEVKIRRHIILAVDENKAEASGCSIDASVKFIQELGQKYNFDALDRLHYTYWIGDTPKLIHHEDLDDAFLKGGMTENTLVVDPLVKDWGQYKENFIRPLKDTFLTRFVDTMNI